MIYKEYREKLGFNIYDHFGLEQADVESRTGGIPLRQHWGVYAWYVLQHYKEFTHSRYNPFISKATVMSDIRGESMVVMV